MTERPYLAILAAAVLTACGSGVEPTSTEPVPLVLLSDSGKAAQSVNATVTFARNRADYTIAASATGFSVTDTVGGGTLAVTASQRLQFADVNVALDANGGGGQIYRIYRAAFGRIPDPAGLGYWIGVSDTGVTLVTIAADFLASQESVDLYGAAPSNDALVTAMYANVLRRQPDPAGYAYWVDVLDKKLSSRAAVLAAISESAENVSAVAPEIATGFSYVPTTRVAGNTVPGAPTIGAATAGDATATLAFTAPASNGGIAISTYAATCSGNGKTASASGSASPLLVSGLVNGTVFACTVKAANSLGYGAASAAVTVTPGAVQASVPDAPSLTSATAGDASATLAFTAPASNGGAAISSYAASCIGGALTKSASGSASPLKVTGLVNGTVYSCSVQAINSAGSGKASGALSVTPKAGATSSSLTGHLYCPYTASVFNATLNLTSTVSVSCSTSTRSMTGNGVPDHITGTFPNGKNPNKIGAVSVNFQASLNPAATGSTTALAHVIGYANNSVKFDPATAESYQNAGVWKIEALNQTYFPFGTDASNAHVQPDGAYHYHGMPEGYMDKLGKGQAMVLLGFAMDGFPIYGRYGYTTANDAASAIKVIKPSWRMKTTPDAGRPSTATVPMGTFTQDYEYVAGLGDLDECNGRTGVTPEFPNGIYHYFITDAYPYVQRCIKGSSLAPPPK